MITKYGTKKTNTTKVFDTFFIGIAKGVLYDDDIAREWDSPNNIDDFPHSFRLLDDDGEVYFYGNSNDDSSFDPLDDYGSAFGCTEIQYKSNGHLGKWEIL